MDGMIATKKMIDNIIDGTTPPQQATKSTQDGDGNIIKSTYATKNELTSGLSGKANTSGSYPNLTVGKATNADKATNATNATNAASATRADNDGNGDSIVDTYAKKSELGPANSKQIVDNTTPTAIASIDDRLTTARNIYFGLPFINDSHDYNSNTKIYAPTSVGAERQLINSNGSSFSWKWVLNAITNQTYSIAGQDTSAHYICIPYTSTSDLIITWQRVNSTGSSAMFQSVTFPTNLHFTKVPTIFGCYYADTNGQVGNAYGWIKEDTITTTGFQIRSYGGQGVTWIAIGYGTAS